MSDPAQTVTPIHEALALIDKWAKSDAPPEIRDDGGVVISARELARLAEIIASFAPKPLLPSPSEREELIAILCAYGHLNDENQLADAIQKAGYSKRSSPSSSEPPDDTRRLNLVADLLDGVRFAHDEDGDPHPVLDWFVGDGGGHVQTTGKDWREAIDKMLLRLYGDAPKPTSPSSAGQEVREAVREALTKLASDFQWGREPIYFDDIIAFRDEHYPALSAGETE